MGVPITQKFVETFLSFIEGKIGGIEKIGLDYILSILDAQVI